MSLLDEFDRSVAANAEIVEGLDAALVEAGRKIAGRIDDVALNAEDPQEITKALYLMPHLMNVLREMYATPKVRREAQLGMEEARGKLASIRGGRNRQAPSKKSA